MPSLTVARGEELFTYSFPYPHPLGRARLEKFYETLDKNINPNIRFTQPVLSGRDVIELFHTPRYVSFVQRMSEVGRGYLDYGDTPAFLGCYQAAAYVVGTTIKLLDLILSGETSMAFNPMGGLHHARRDSAGGFCIFNDAGVAIEYLLRKKGVGRVAYVDIDAHHGDGVCYDFYSDERVLFADIHQDGRTLYPGTGFRHETGSGQARGLKLNIPLMPFSGDSEFIEAFHEVEDFLMRHEFQFILFQCGADGLDGDPITNLKYTHLAHGYAAERLAEIADMKCGGRLLAMGGGGYNPENVARAWVEVARRLSGVR
ncbi:MAG: acetoin utilization protein AcuC [Nitrososphaerota archaeon]